MKNTDNTQKDTLEQLRGKIDKLNRLRILADMGHNDRVSLNFSESIKGYQAQIKDMQV